MTNGRPVDGLLYHEDNNLEKSWARGLFQPGAFSLLGGDLLSVSRQRNEMSKLAPVTVTRRERRVPGRASPFDRFRRFQSMTSERYGAAGAHSPGAAGRAAMRE